ncbi:hypothetical protein [Legionella hackeliae]|uniref:Uncharacterized protein n=1 Tax=Legionella hackeliae TaxID=449 RepID=A0A0A8US52_LEGHA|nr:hypothetical protein [Legionella hackeliae]CEK09927.1 protein of unknown function [ankyrin domain] [Legionella hackeliae]STX49843.1 Uncharacterised protein [Legionella hackeliae]
MSKKELIASVKALIKEKKVRKADQILAKIEKGQYGKALLLACKNCKAGDSDMLILIKLICRYKDKLSINIDYSEDGVTPITYAALNTNVDVFQELMLAGANMFHPYSSSRIVGELFNDNIKKAKETIAPFYKKQFQEEYQQLNACFNDSNLLPKRKEVVSETENATFDLNRIQFIIQALDFIKKYQDLTARFNPLPRGLKSSDLSMAEIELVEKCRILIEQICVCIQNLSYELRSELSSSFAPTPFTWITFDQFGGLAKEPPLNQIRVIPIVDIQVKDAHDLTPNISPMTSAVNMLNELADHQEIVEAALKDFINKDSDSLKAFFQEVAVRITHPAENPIKPVTLPCVKAITTYVSDLENLIKLLNLVNFTGKLEPKRPVFSFGNVLMTAVRDRTEQYKTRFNLTTKRGQHAALRLLEMIGELITGKNFSQFLCRLDNSIDWRAFILVRDGIVHQDEGDNKYQIDQLLENIPLLEKIFGEDLSEFWSRLVNLLVLREQKLGVYRNEPTLYWSRILKLDAENKSAEEEQIPVPVVQIERRATLEDEQTFIEALREKNAAASVIDTCKAIFDGTGKIPPKMQIGEIIRCLPTRAEDKERNKKLVAIMTKATSKPSTTESARNEKRAQDQAARERRELEKRQRLKGLEHIRGLAEKLHQADPTHLLNRKKRVMAAFEALLNVKTFLMEEHYLFDDLPYTTLSEWDAHHEKDSGLTLAKLLEANYELNDAIEYNAAQFLQHLNTIKEYPEAAICNQIIDNYEDLRAFRNYLEHGDPLYDNERYNSTQVIPTPDLRQRLTAPMFIKLVYEILPELIKMVDTFVADPHLTPLVSPEEDKQWTLACTQGYKDNGFFVSNEKKTAANKACTQSDADNECKYG